MIMKKSIELGHPKSRQMSQFVFFANYTNLTVLRIIDIEGF